MLIYPSNLWRSDVRAMERQSVKKRREERGGAQDRRGERRGEGVTPSHNAADLPMPDAPPPSNKKNPKKPTIKKKKRKSQKGGELGHSSPM